MTISLTFLNINIQDELVAFVNILMLIRIVIMIIIILINYKDNYFTSK